ncbi:aminopeptidase P family protein [Frateuria aurantia]
MPSANPHRDRVQALRARMQAHQVQACIVPSADPHFSEYLPPHWQARVWLSGFTGSAGTLVVCADHAGVWTDGRYFVQAESELEGSGIELMKLRVPHTAEHVEWLLEHLGPGATVAVVADSISLAGRDRLQQQLEARGMALRTDLDLPAEVWDGRPALPRAPVFVHELALAGASRTDKLIRIKQAMQPHGASHHLVSSLDDIAWITNLRGSDVECNPVFLSHLLIAAEGPATLFTDLGRVAPEVQAELRHDGVDLADYAEVSAYLAGLAPASVLLLSPAHIACSVAASIPAGVHIVHAGNPSTLFKAIKSEHELAHIRETMRLDGAALVRGARRLLERVASGEALTELDVADIFLEARAGQPGFMGVSFDTIAGYQANGALPHYHATPELHASLQAEGLLLVDSGGQYLGGTTDITRMWALGPVTDAQRVDSTRVLKGMIGLSRARFPAGANGPQLDALARAPLWQSGLDFGHGTGHGVGYFLNVHEGPHGIRPPAPGGALVPLQVGMINSIEPGLYRPGRYGIRHENLAVIRPALSTEFGDFLEFETLTLCPIDPATLEPALLDAEERAWLDSYHARVLEALSPLLEPEERAWLGKLCGPIAEYSRD